MQCIAVVFSNVVWSILSFNSGVLSCMCSPRYCITCGKWLLSLLMPNFFSDLYQMHQSMLSLSLSPSLSLLYTFMLLFLCIIILLSTCYFHFCSKNVTIKFARRTDVMPPVPLETKHHPSSVDLLLIKRLIAETSKQNLLQFLQHEFVNIGKSLAERLIGEKINIYILSVCNSTIKFCGCNNNPSQFFRGNGSRI
jgi:hypothetical protein